MGNVADGIVSTAKEVLGPVVDPLLDIAKEVLPLVEDPVTAVLPETEVLFKSASKLLGSDSTSNSRAASDKHQALKLIDELPGTKGSGKQAKMLRVLELFLDELEAEL